MTENHWCPKAGNEAILARALMLKNIRAFFDARGVIEVETPLLSHYAVTDVHLDSIRASFRGHGCYLNTSPEYAMKRLLAASNQSIYQICKAFRDDELGPFHNPEFTLLEWYRTGFDMRQLMHEVADLVAVLYQSSGLSSVTGPSFVHLSYQQAFEKFAGFNPHQADAEKCYRVAEDNNIEIPRGLTTNSDSDVEVNAWLDWLLMQLVMPAFGKQDFTFLYDYPASQCALAKVKKNEQQIAVAERFELFYGELELANGFNELTDVDEQFLRFSKDNQQRRKAGKEEVCIDVNFINALDSGMPECSGVALGLDRILMVLTDTACIEQVLTFSWENA